MLIWALDIKKLNSVLSYIRMFFFHSTENQEFWMPFLSKTRVDTTVFEGILVELTIEINLCIGFAIRGRMD
jgi:hypothetical protein